ncbi:MAG: hypothetical protein L3J24_03995 [Xanthomonadales bacterium]|nr:hypothetical protein [Xanthomonadales bacterium]
MTLWTMITLIAVAGIIAGVFESYNKTKRRAASNEGLDALTQRMDRLESELKGRIETLEAIITDRRSNLKREFDYLDKAS